MVHFNNTNRELTARIVYYGPGLSGKTTNLKALHERLDSGSTGRLLSLATSQDRTIYFDLLPVELGNIKGYTVRFQLCTVPGQVFYNETRKLVLKGVDGIVFVADSQWSMLSHNLESFQNLKENLKDLGAGSETLPLVIQYNKRDLPGVLSIEALQESLGFGGLPFVESVASEGRGVVETFKLASKLTFIDLMKRLQRPVSFAGIRAEPLASSVPLEGGDPRSLASVAPITEPVPIPASDPPVPDAATDSPFEMAADLPSPPTDEIWGLPPARPEPEPAEELTQESPPVLTEEPSVPEPPRAEPPIELWPVPEVEPVPEPEPEPEPTPVAEEAVEPKDDRTERLEKRIEDLERKLDRLVLGLRRVFGEADHTEARTGDVKDASSGSEAEDPRIG